MSYKCILSWHDCYELPVLVVRYRSFGSIFWKHFRQPIDQLAKRKCYGEYKNSSLPLYAYSSRRRIKIFDDILRNQYEGNLDTYVKEVAYMELHSKYEEDKDETWANSTMDGWLTSKWKRLEIDIV